MKMDPEWWDIYTAVVGGIASKKFQVAYTERVMGGEYMDNPAELELDESDFKMAADTATKAVRFAKDSL